MEITGKIIIALPEVSGTSKAGNAWKKKEYVLETQETYPKKVHFDFFGERADQYPLQVGEVKKISFDIESREYQGRWYTSIRAWKAEDPATAQPSAAPQAAPAAYGTVPPQAPYPGAPAAYGAQQMPGSVPPPPMPTAEPSDDLPF